MRQVLSTLTWGKKAGIPEIGSVSEVNPTISPAYHLDFQKMGTLRQRLGVFLSCSNEAEWPRSHDCQSLQGTEIGKRELQREKFREGCPTSLEKRADHCTHGWRNGHWKKLEGTVLGGYQIQLFFPPARVENS